MAFRNEGAVVTTTPTLLVAVEAGDVDVWIMPRANAEYFIGGSDLAIASNGLRLSADEIFHSRVRPGDEIWAMVEGGTLSVRALVRSA